MKTARGTLRTPQRNDLTRQPRKLRGPACCPGCGAVYRGGRWRWEEVPAAPRAERGRFHIDVTVPHDAAEERIAAALAAGGRLVTDRYARSWWVLADAEGNEACICTWQDRG